MADASPANGATSPLEGLLAGLRLALGAGTVARQREALAGVVDWPAVARLVAYHRVGALFLAGIRTGGVEVPDPEVARRLALLRRRGVLRGARQYAAMCRVTDALDAAGIPSLILKGLPLGQRLYGSPFAKSSIDVDLLVPEAGFAAAAGLLRELGWRRTVPDFRETSARMRWYDSVQKEHVFTGRGSRIELHRRLLSNPFLFDPPFDALYSRALCVEVGPDRFCTLGDADQLVYLGCHGSCHYWQRLKWLCDFAALLRTMGDDCLEQAAAAGRRARLETAIGAVLLLCRQHLQVEPPRPIAALARDGARVRLVTGLSRRAWKPRGGLWRIAWKTSSRVGRFVIGTGFRFRLHEARALLVRYQVFARLDLPDRLFWLYPLLWPLLVALRLRRRPAARAEASAGRDRADRAEEWRRGDR